MAAAAMAGAIAARADRAPVVIRKSLPGRDQAFRINGIQHALLRHDETIAFVNDIIPAHPVRRQIDGDQIRPGAQTRR